MQAITHALPLTQLNDAMRGLLFGLGRLRRRRKAGTKPVAVLAAWCVATLVFARLRFKW